MSLRLNEDEITMKVFDAIPVQEASFISQNMNAYYLPRLLSFLSRYANAEVGRPHVEYQLVWLLAILNHHGQYIKDHIANLVPSIRALLKTVSKQRDQLAKL